MPPVPSDPLIADWHWVAGQMTTLLDLARQFTLAFTEAKRELAAVDFHDLEQYALRLLWDRARQQPTDIARQWRQRLRFVFVDEYQDINSAQDKIIECLCREGAQANRFMVGDVKQSIYRFRLANPSIFQSFVDRWGKKSSLAGSAVILSENFRSREALLDFANAFFGSLMRRELGGVAYDNAAKLRFGAPDKRQPLSIAANAEPAVELHLRIRKSRKAEEEEANENGNENEDELLDLGDADKEARLLGLRLREMHAQQFPVWDEGKQEFRPVEWGDMAILLRSRVRKAECYAKEFARLNIPLFVERGNFYQTFEVSDLLNLLRLLDNPLQDLPVLAVLRSPLVGLTVDELATIRLCGRGPFWRALRQCHQRGESREKRGEARPEMARPSAALLASLSVFLDRFHHWRRLARHVSVVRCLDAILAETHYGAWLLTQPQGEQHYANVQRLLGLAQQFDRYQRHGLFRFLRFVEAQELAEVEPPVAAVSAENSVRLMSIHQSKGLEFPVVALPDLAKPFNVSDQRADIILDEQFGLCPQIKPPQTGKRYPSLPHWLVSHRQYREMLGEEMRLLYVAMTRAKDRLILSATLTERRFNERWKVKANLITRRLASAKGYADWVGAWFSQQFDLSQSIATSGGNGLLLWRIHDDEKLRFKTEQRPAETQTPAVFLENLPVLREKLEWQYPFTLATQALAKSSVTFLRRRAAEDLDEERGERRGKRGNVSAQFSQGSSLSKIKEAAEIGNAHHKFLQFVSLQRVVNAKQLTEEAERLKQEGHLTVEEISLLDFEGLASFWQSPLGQRALAKPEFIRRELLFTARFSLEELELLTAASSPPSSRFTLPSPRSPLHEFVVVQGVADLVVLLPSELWLVDFKTDRASPNALTEKVQLYEPQLRLYGQALSRVYRRPVTGCWLYFLSTRTAIPIETH